MDNNKKPGWERHAEERAHTDHLIKIALGLFEQLKSENITFSDAERVVDVLYEAIRIERGKRRI